MGTGFHHMIQVIRRHGDTLIFIATFSVASVAAGAMGFAVGMRLLF